MRSITFPAIGTGILGFPKRIAAAFMFEEILKFSSKSNSQHLREVCFIVHPSDKDTLRAFSKELSRHVDRNAAIGTPIKMAAAGPSPSLQSVARTSAEYFIPNKAPKSKQKLSAFQLVEGIEPVMFSLCAEDKSDVERTKAWLQKQIEQEHAEKVIQEELISELEEAEVKKFSDLQKKFQVSVIYKPPDSSIQILGLTRDVLAVSGEIEKIINRIKERKNRERTAELTAKLVEWKFEAVGGNMRAFDMMTNLELEEAKNDKKDKLTIQIRGQQYSVSLQKEKATDTQGNTINIQRVVKHEGASANLPQHWKPMGNNLVMEVDVPPGSSEYTIVQQKFQQSCRNKILKILRVQNRDLWLNYQIKKQSIESKNGSTNNERELFHGTDVNSIQHVNHNGFNWSYAGRNAAAIGNGTYFAVNASYSASSTYSRPDANGQKHMYLARVLTGQYCQGRAGMITPPAKSSANPTDLYDSVTDNVLNPAMFVIFHDIQAYPEYHIIFH